MADRIFVGRESQLSVMLDLYDEAASGLGKTLLINGNSLSGKSALVNEFFKRIRDDNKHIAVEADSAVSHAYAFNSFKKIVARCFACGRQEAEHKIISCFESAGNDWIKLVNAVSLIDFSKRDFTLPSVDSQSVCINNDADVFAVFDCAFRNIAVKTLPVIFINHLHFAELSELNLFCKLVLSLRQNPYKIFFIATFDIKSVDLFPSVSYADLTLFSFSDRLSELRGYSKKEAYVNRSDNWFVEIEIPLLSLASVSSYISKYFPDNRFPGDFVNNVFKIVHGHAGFMVQFIDYLIQKRYIFFDGKTACLIDNFSWEYTSSLYEVVLRRIDDFEKRLKCLKFNYDLNRRDENIFKDTFFAADVNIAEFVYNILSKRNFLNTVDFLRVVNLVAMSQEICSAYLKFASDYNSDGDFLDAVYRVLRFLKSASDINEKISEQKLNSDNGTSINPRIGTLAKQSSADDLLKAAADCKEQFAMREVITNAEATLSVLKQSEHRDKAVYEKIFNAYVFEIEAFIWLGYYKRGLLCIDSLLKDTQAFDNKFFNGMAEYYRGRCLFYLADYENANVNFESALKIAVQLDDQKFIADCQNSLGLLQTALIRYDDAQQSFSAALSIYNKLLNRELVAETMLNMGNLRRFKGDYDTAVKIFNDAMQVFSADAKKNQIAKAYNNIGLCYNSTGDRYKAIEYFENALRLDLEINDKINMANRYNNIGLAKNDMGDYTGALKYYKLALEIDETLNDLPKMAISFDNIGLVLLATGDLVGAENYFNKALEINTQLNNISGMAFSFSNFGNLYMQSEQTDKAMDYFKKALEIDLDNNDENSMMTDYNNIGNVYYHNGIYDQALEYFDKSLEIAMRTSDVLSSAAIYNNYANIYFARQEYDLSFKYYLKALHINFIKDDKPAVSMNYNNLAGIYDVQNKFDRAIKCYLKAVEIDISLNDRVQQAAHLDNLALSYLNSQKFDEASDCFNNAESIYRELKNFNALIVNLRNHGETLRMMNFSKDAEKYFKESLQISLENGDNYNAALAYDSLGIIYNELSIPEKAVKSFKEAVSLFSSEGEDAEYIGSTRHLAETFSQESKVDDALFYYQQLINFYNRKKDHSGLSEIFSSIAEMYSSYKYVSDAEIYYKKMVDELALIPDTLKSAEYYYSAGMFFYSQAKNIEHGLTYITRSSEIINLFEPDVYNSRTYILIYSALGDIYFEKKNSDEAVLWYNKAVDIADKFDQFLQKASLLNNIGYVYDTDCCYFPACSYYKSAFRAYQSDMYQINVDGLINNAKNVGLMYEHLEKYEEAAEWLKTAADFFQEVDEPDELALILCSVAECQLKAGVETKYPIENYTKALEYFKSSFNREGILQASRSLALIYSADGDFKKGLALLENSIKSVTDTGDKNLIARAYQDSGSLYFNNGDIKKAIDLYSKAKDVYAENDDWESMADAYFELATLFSVETEHYSKTILYNKHRRTRDSLAVEFFSDALKISRGSKNSEFEIICLKSLAGLHFECKRDSQALDIYRQAEKISIERQDYSSASEILIYIADVYYKLLNDIENTKQSYEKSLQYAIKSENESIRTAVIAQYAYFLYSTSNKEAADELVNSVKEIFRYILSVKEGLSDYLPEGFAKDYEL